MERAILIILFTALGGGAGLMVIYTFNRIPAKWLCDYDEDPSQEMWGIRIKSQPWAWVFPLVFAGTALKLLEMGVSYALPGIVSLCLLLHIGIADKKYMIIPDQHVISLGLVALGFVPFQSSFWSPLLGALVGGGSFLLVGILGKFIYKTEVLGFGDVKLLFVIGLMCGLKGMLLILFFTILSSSIVFAVGLLTRKIKGRDQQPLGPFICGSTAIYILFKKEIFDVVQFYSDIFHL